jgi:hypothetical protein
MRRRTGEQRGSGRSRGKWRRAEGMEIICVLRLFGLKSKEVGGRWRKLHNERFHKVYTSLNIIWEIRSGKMR